MCFLRFKINERLIIYCDIIVSCVLFGKESTYMELEKNVLIFVLPYILGLATLEILWSLKTKREYAWNEALASLMILGFRRIFVVGINFELILWLGRTVAPYRLFDLPVYRDQVWHPVNAILLFIAVEFFYYWFHRWSHEVRWFWASHSVHHSPNKMNFMSAERLAWTGGLVSGFILFFPILLLGFDTKTVVIGSTLNLLYQYWLHTEMIGKLGWFEKVFNTPSHHRVHHASNPRYLDANYGGVTILFDRLFGTFIEETKEEKIVYGLVTPLYSINPFRIAFNGWVGIIKDIRSYYKEPRLLFHYVFGRPGWSHDGSRKSSQELRKEFLANHALNGRQ